MSLRPRSSDRSTSEAAPETHRDERGASAVEYGLLVAGIAAVIAAVVFFLGGPTLGMYKNTCDGWNQQTGNTETC